MTLEELTLDHIGAHATVSTDTETSGTIISFGWGGKGEANNHEGRIDFYGGKSVTVPLSADCIELAPVATE